MAIADPKLAARLAQMSTEEKLDAILGMLVRIERKLGAGRAPAEAGPTVAPEAELDSRYGDEEIRKDPKRWSGDSYAGKRMSETEPEYLDCLAEFSEWAAEMSEAKAQEKAQTEPVAAAKERTSSRYRRATARRARGWAARLRGGWTPPAEGEEEQENW
jgi:hypothetical protein